MLVLPGLYLQALLGRRQLPEYTVSHSRQERWALEQNSPLLCLLLDEWTLTRGARMVKPSRQEFIKSLPGADVAKALLVG